MGRYVEVSVVLRVVRRLPAGFCRILAAPWIRAGVGQPSTIPEVA
jgi:hypothetical protein